jgi:hypothetical protein
MREMNGQMYVSDAMGLFRHRPFCLHVESVCCNSVARAKSPDEIGDTARHRPDEQFNGTGSCIKAAVLDRLIRDNAMLSGDDVMPGAAVIAH